MLVVALPARFPLRFLLALVLGALHAAAFIDDTTWPIELATLAGLAALVVRAAREPEGFRGTRRAAFAAARAGFGFGLGWFLAGVSWIYISLHTYGEMNALIAAGGVFLLAAYLALYPALACALYAGLLQARRPGPLVAIGGFAGLWTASEFARGVVFTGFPWLASGYAHVAGPLGGYASVVGVYGVCLVAAAIAITIALAAVRGPSLYPRPRVVVALAIVVGLPLIGQGLRTIDWTQADGPPIAVRLLQGNVPQDIKFDESRFLGIANDYLAMIEAKPAALIVLPETAFPTFLDELPRPLLERLVAAATKSRSAVAFGVPIYEGNNRYFNSVVAFDPVRVPPVPQAAIPAALPSTSGESPPSSPPALTGDVRPEELTLPEAEPDPLLTLHLQRYDKSHLVPFGEFIPTGFHWFVALMRMPLGDFTRGTTTPEPMVLAGKRIAFNICYEDLFGEEIRRQAAEAHILVNVSNVAWFGDSMALPQHLDISRMRTLETGRPMLRSTNTGMTAAIGPHAQVLAKLDPFTKGSLDVDVQGMTGLTPFVRWGNDVAIGLALLLIVAMLFRGPSDDAGARIAKMRVSSSA